MRQTNLQQIDLMLFRSNSLFSRKQLESRFAKNYLPPILCEQSRKHESMLSNGSQMGVGVPLVVGKGASYTIF